MSLTNYGENIILNHIFKVSVYTPPTNLYIALFTSDPTDKQ